MPKYSVEGKKTEKDVYIKEKRENLAKYLAFATFNA